MEDDDAAFNDNALASKKKRKLLPADIEDNAGKKVRAELVVTRRSSDPSLEQKYADESFGMVVSLHDQKRQKYKVMQHRRRYVLEELNLPRSIDYWTVEDVADWTGYIGFPNYKETFFKNNINGEVLNSLTKEDLKDMNIRAIGDRILILNARDALKRNHSISDVGENQEQYQQYLLDRQLRQRERLGSRVRHAHQRNFQRENERQVKSAYSISGQTQERSRSHYEIPSLKVADAHKTAADIGADSARSSTSSA